MLVEHERGAFVGHDRVRGPARPGPSRRVTDAPRSAARRARKSPSEPVAKLLRWRMPSTGTQVGPAVTRIGRPASFIGFAFSLSAIELSPDPRVKERDLLRFLL